MPSVVPLVVACGVLIVTLNAWLIARKAKKKQLAAETTAPSPPPSAAVPEELPSIPPPPRAEAAAVAATPPDAVRAAFAAPPPEPRVDAAPPPDAPFATITEILAGSPADAAGLRVGDLVVTFGDATAIDKLKPAVLASQGPIPV